MITTACPLVTEVRGEERAHAAAADDYHVHNARSFSPPSGHRGFRSAHESKASSSLNADRATG